MVPERLADLGNRPGPGIAPAGILHVRAARPALDQPISGAKLDRKRSCLQALQSNDGGDRAIGHGDRDDSQRWLAPRALVAARGPSATPRAGARQPTPASEGQAAADPDAKRPRRRDHGVSAQAKDARLLPGRSIDYGKRRPLRAASPP